MGVPACYRLPISSLQKFFRNKTPTPRTCLGEKGETLLAKKLKIEMLKHRRVERG
jgi:hypothetical protein